MVAVVALAAAFYGLKFDPAAKRFTNNEDANKWLKAPSRGEWNIHDLKAASAWWKFWA